MTFLLDSVPKFKVEECFFFAPVSPPPDGDRSPVDALVEVLPGVILGLGAWLSRIVVFPAIAGEKQI